MVDTNTLISLIPLLPLLGFLIIGLNVNKLSNKLSAYIACCSVFISFLLSVTAFVKLLNAPIDHRFFSVTIISWIKTAGFSADIAFLVDPREKRYPRKIQRSLSS